jgi:streptolysin S family bacteriocin protoxin
LQLHLAAPHVQKSFKFEVLTRPSQSAVTVEKVGASSCCCCCCWRAVWLSAASKRLATRRLSGAAAGVDDGAAALHLPVCIARWQLLSLCLLLFAVFVLLCSACFVAT